MNYEDFINDWIEAHWELVFSSGLMPDCGTYF
jgi:hypothetical protein